MDLLRSRFRLESNIPVMVFAGLGDFTPSPSEGPDVTYTKKSDETFRTNLE